VGLGRLIHVVDMISYWKHCVIYECRYTLRLLDAKIRRDNMTAVDVLTNDREVNSGLHRVL
jgi:hypothetical protein